MCVFFLLISLVFVYRLFVLSDSVASGVAVVVVFWVFCCCMGKFELFFLLVLFMEIRVSQVQVVACM